MDASVLVFIGCAVSVAGLLSQLRLRRRGAWRTLGAAASIRAHGRLGGASRRGDDAGLRLLNAGLMSGGLALALVGVMAM